MSSWKNRVQLGRKSDPYTKICVNNALNEGYEVFEQFDPFDSDKNQFYIEIGGVHPPYRAPDAVFKPIASGLYVFRDNQIIFIGDSE